MYDASKGYTKVHADEHGNLYVNKHLQPTYYVSLTAEDEETGKISIRKGPPPPEKTSAATRPKINRTPAPGTAATMSSDQRK